MRWWRCALVMLLAERVLFLARVPEELEVHVPPPPIINHSPLPRVSVRVLDPSNLCEIRVYHHYTWGREVRLTREQRPR